MVGQAIAFENEILWLISCHTETLLKIDWNTKNVVDGYQIPVKEIHEYGHNVMKKCGDRLYIFPLYSKGVFCFDIDRQQFDEVNLEYEGRTLDCKVRIAIATTENHIIFVDSITNELYDFDTNKNTVRKMVDGLLRELEKKGIDTHKSIFGWQHYYIDKQLYIPVINSNLLVCIDMMRDIFSVRELNSEEGVMYINGCEKDIIMTTNDGREIIYDRDGRGAVRDLIDIQRDGGRDLYPFYVGDSKIFLTYNQRRLYVENAGVIKRIDIPYIDENNRYPDGEYSQFEAIFIRNQVLYFQARANGNLFSYNPSSNEICKNIIRISDRVLQSIMYQITRCSKKFVFSEDDYLSLANFIMAV